VTNDTTLAAALSSAAARYLAIGRFAWKYAGGKIHADPAYRAILPHLTEAELLLDVGCGPGYLLACARACYPELQLIGIDHDPRRLDLARRAFESDERILLCREDARSGRWPSADVITCIDVLHYLPVSDQDALLCTLVGQLRPGGKLLLRECARDAGWRARLTRWCERLCIWIGKHRGDGLYFRAPEELRGVLESLGLEVAVEPCSQGTFLANVLVVGRRTAVSEQPTARVGGTAKAL
jgi:SAM-dependent methyltransferase